MKFGAHMPTRGGVWKALERGQQIGCETVQIFVKNQRQWFGSPPPAAAVARYQAERARSGIAPVFAHAGYLINLAAPPSANRTQSLQSLVQELHLANALQLPFVVLHPGAHLGAAIRTGIRQVIAALNEVIRATKNLPVRIALENTAGQGTAVGQTVGELATIFDGVQQPARLGICLDTAHLFAAGYDIRTPKGWNAVVEQVESAIGLDHVLAIHLNDSQTGLGSRVDRHAGIGRGRLGKRAFRHIVNDARFAEHPGCLETPKSDDLREDVENLAVLRSLVKR